MTTWSPFHKLLFYGYILSAIIMHELHLETLSGVLFFFYCTSYLKRKRDFLTGICCVVCHMR
jgi:hypothetical protein